VRATEDNADPHQGITVRLIAGFARQLCPNLYRGLFDVRRIPSRRRLAATPRFTVILKIDSHFVVVHATPDTLIYADPLGEPCQDARARGFIVDCARPRVLFNEKPIQSQRSVACGLYALLFARCFDSPVSEWPFRAGSELPLRFRRVSRHPDGADRRNDVRCARYLRRFIRRVGRRRR